MISDVIHTKRDLEALETQHQLTENTAQCKI